MIFVINWNVENCFLNGTDMMALSAIVVSIYSRDKYLFALNLC